MTSEIIPIGSDHAGFTLKAKIIELLKNHGFVPQDEGCYDESSVHYPQIGKRVASLVAENRVKRGILICGTGIGMSITANRFKGVRGTLCHDESTASMAREHNDSNLLVLGARVLSEDLALKIVQTWLDTPFAGGRHQDRLNMIEEN
ncbi:MAG: ribose 5-phosphate isomerase B [SAR324 cluster bacterium]|nr:ribose 5-phosphate isomerase B [SAR324 cluster bacterium]